MSRPKRKAAQDAVSKIQVQDVYHWENLSESSQEFQKCAEQIEKEFANEGSKKRSWFDAKTGNFTESFTDSECSDENCDSDENESIDSDSEYSDDSFVVHDINYNSDDDYAQDTDGDNKYLQTSDEESEVLTDTTRASLSLSLSLSLSSIRWIRINSSSSFSSPPHLRTEERLYRTNALHS